MNLVLILSQGSESGYDRFLAVENAILYKKSFHFRYNILFIGQINLHGVK